MTTTTTMDRISVESEIGLELPASFEKYDETIQQQIIEYLQGLDAIEKKAYTIGKKHLGTSFNVVRSNGFVNWLKEKREKEEKEKEKEKGN